MKAIETEYKGFRFRSRLEARWAVFLDDLNIEWEYEKEGFNLDSGPYLPDFWLPHICGGTWLEIKGDMQSESTLAKPIALAEAGQRVLVGGPMKEDGRFLLVGGSGRYAVGIFSPVFVDVSHDDLGALGTVFAGYGIAVVAPNCEAKGKIFFGEGADYKDWKVRPIASDVLTRAATAARSARFEHGENGAPK